jgi:hypothetical protein
MAKMNLGHTAFVAAFDQNGDIEHVELPDGTIITEPTAPLPEQPLKKINLRRVSTFDVLVWDELDEQGSPRDLVTGHDAPLPVARTERPVALIEGSPP